MDVWADGIHTLSQVVHKNLQAAYAGLKRSLKQEWVFVQRATKGLGDDFQLAEKALHEDFLPRLFLGDSEAMPSRKSMGFSVNKSGMAIPEPTQIVHCNWTAL